MCLGPGQCDLLRLSPSSERKRMTKGYSLVELRQFDSNRLLSLYLQLCVPVPVVANC